MLEYVPETVYRVARHFTKAKLIIPIIYVKVGRRPQAHRGHVGGLLPLPSWSMEAYVPSPQFCGLQMALAKPRPRGWERNCTTQQSQCYWVGADGKAE